MLKKTALGLLCTVIMWAVALHLSQWLDSDLLFKIAWLPVASIYILVIMAIDLIEKFWIWAVTIISLALFFYFCQPKSH